MLLNNIIALCEEALLVSIIASAPAISASLIIGITVAIFSATTQIQEQTLSFAPKMIGIYAVLLLLGVPLGGLILSFTQKCFSVWWIK